MANLAAVDQLNFVPRRNAVGRDVNPVTASEVILYGNKFALGPLDPDELIVFQAQFADLMSMVGSDERKIMLARVEQYVFGLRAIKQKLGNQKFAGVNAGDNEVGMSLIRPQFTKNNTPAAAALTMRANWLQVLPAAGVWADWFMDAALTPYQLGKDFGMVVTHLKSLVTPAPFMTEARFVIGRSGILLPVDTRNLRLADTENNVPIIPIPTMILTPNETLYGRARSDVAGTDNVPLGGLLFGLGECLAARSSYLDDIIWLVFNRI